MHSRYGLDQVIMVLSFVCSCNGMAENDKILYISVLENIWGPIMVQFSDDFGEMALNKIRVDTIRPDGIW